MTIQVVEIKAPYISSYTSISYKKFFQGTEQLILETYEYDNNWSQGTNVYVKKEPIKVMLESISYELRNGDLRIDHIEVFGFRKDGKIKARSSWFHNFNNPQFVDVLPQIPDSFHDEARTFFDTTLKKLSDELLEARQKGLQIK